MFSNINMKKVVLWLTIITVFSFAIGFTIIFAQSGSNWFSMNSESFNKQTIDTEKTFSTLDLKHINVKTISTDVSVIPTDDTNIKVHFYGSAKARNQDIPELITNELGNKLNIEVKHKFKINIGLNFNSFKLKLDVYVPKSYINDISLDTVSGNVDISNLGFDKLKWHSVSGDLDSESFTAKDSDLDTVSGDVSLDRFSGNITFNSVSGSIDTVYSEFDNNISVHTTSGRGIIRLPDASEFNLDFETVSGDFNSDFALTMQGTNNKRSVEGKVGNKNNKITFGSVSGDLKIEYAK